MGLNRSFKTIKPPVLALFLITMLICLSPSTLADANLANNDRAKQHLPVVIIDTTLGGMTVELYPSHAPASVDNFLNYVDQGFYTDIIFHRVVPGFVIQAGGFDSKRNKRKVKGEVRNESIGGMSNKPYTLAMARTNHPDSASSQFYINLTDNHNLDARGTKHGYTVFGKVIGGMEVVDKIAAAKTANLGGAFAQTPLTPIIILNAKRASPTVISAD